jgi:hypothetical protein
VSFQLSTLGGLFVGAGGERAGLWLEGFEREASADLAGVGVTRYPPALLSAFERIAAASSRELRAVQPGVAARTARCWLAPLVAGEPGSSINDRIDVLREL